MFKCSYLQFPEKRRPYWFETKLMRPSNVKRFPTTGIETFVLTQYISIISKGIVFRVLLPSPRLQTRQVLEPHICGVAYYVLNKL